MNMQWSTGNLLRLIFVLIGIIGLLGIIDVGKGDNFDQGSIIATTVVFSFIIFFVSYIPLVYYSYSINRKPVIKKDISNRLHQTNLQTDTLDQTFEDFYGDKQYKLPIFLVTIVTFAGFLLVFFPTGLSGFKEVVYSGDLIEYIKAITKAPPITYGFIGAYLFSIQLIFRRYVQYDLKPEVFMFVTMRILITLILTFVISLFFWSTEGTFPSFALAFSFLVGIFPKIGLKWIEYVVSVKLMIKSENFKESMPLNAIEGLTIWHEIRLLEEDIENIQNLATTNIENLLITTRFDAQRLMDWVDQALLLIHLEPGKIENWRGAGIRTATDVLDLLVVEENKAKVAKVVESSEDEIEIIFCTLKRDPNIQHVYSFRKNISIQSTL